MRWLCVLLLLTPLAAAQILPVYPLVPEPQPYPECGIEANLFGQAGVALENLWFENGTLYVTAFDEGLWMAAEDGLFTQVVATPGHATNPAPVDNDESFMGITSIDGALYVTQGQSVATPVEARILRFETPGGPDFTVFAAGFDGLNGLAADTAGNLYAAHGFREGIYKVLPDGSWDLWLTAPVANGVSAHPDGERLVFMQVTDTGARVMAARFDDPADQEMLFQFNAVSSYDPSSIKPDAPVVPNIVDDIAVLPDGRVLITAHERLLTIMGDPATGEACVLFDQHQSAPTSVRLAQDFGPWTGHVFVTDNAGEVWTALIMPLESSADAPPDREAESRSTPVPLFIILGATLVAAIAVRQATRT